MLLSMKITVSIAEQNLLYEDGPIRLQYPISSGKAGVGQEMNSGKTPLGRHCIRAKIGHDCPKGAVFVGRRWTGEVFSEELAVQHPNRDWILTRILWLSGLEVGKNRLGNVDTMRRYIYIHGTSDEEYMGQPVSHGCIRMRNDDILALYQLVTPGTEVLIEE